MKKILIIVILLTISVFAETIKKGEYLLEIEKEDILKKKKN